MVQRKAAFNIKSLLALKEAASKDYSVELLEHKIKYSYSGTVQYDLDSKCQFDASLHFYFYIYLQIK